MSRVVLSVQFLRTKALLSLDHGAAEAEQFGTGRTEQWYELARYSSSAVAEFDTAERIN